MVRIRPNSKTTIEDIEISCYGEDMVMIDHWAFSAPMPVGPKDHDHEKAEGIEHTDFWDRSDEERLEIILDYLDNRIEWDYDAMMTIGEDIHSIRESLV